VSNYTIFTKLGQRITKVDFAAYADGVYSFAFFGDETYIDPFDGSTWYWTGTTNDTDEIIGLTQDTFRLVSVLTLPECTAQPGSFFWDNVNGYLYVHWFNSLGDWAVGNAVSSLEQLVAGFANGYHEASHNVFDGVYYKPIITNISGLSETVDPTKLGLLANSQSSITYSDQINAFDRTTLENSTGLPYWVYAIDKDTIELTDDDRVFTGVLNGYSHPRNAFTISLIEARLFENKPTCINVISLTDYPDAGGLEGEFMPTPWGKIRRGIVVPTNSDTLTTAASGTATLLVGDPSLYEVLAISKVYDKEDNEITIGSVDLVACTVDITKPAGVSVSDLKKWKWEGQGYDILGTYDNGLDIIKAAFLSLAGVSFIAGTYDLIEWQKQTNINTQSKGLSLQTDKGFFEEIIEVIATGLQGSVRVLGNGRITWVTRDITQDPILHSYKYNQLAIPTIVVDPSKVVSEIAVQYSPDFTDDKQFLQIVYTDDRAAVVRNYGVDKRDPISPVKTALTLQSDADDTAEKIAATSSAPERRITIPQKDIDKGLKDFNIIGVDTALLQEDPYIEYGELLQNNPDYNTNNQSLVIRVLPDYVPPIYVQGESFSNGLYDSEGFGLDGGDGFGATFYERSN
jgi:hypothetical protein